MNENIENIVDRKNLLIKELYGLLKYLDGEKIDRLCDGGIMEEVKKHPAINLQNNGG